jgi:LacI family transcriptional regulator
MPYRVTMSDVAREAGVSLMTVSRVINDKGEISPETKKRVQEVIEELGYRPSSIARSLAGGQTYTIGLVVPDIANPYFSGMAHGIAEVAYAEDFSVLLCDCEENPERELAMLAVLEEKRVDGVVLAAPRAPSEKLIPLLARHSNAVVVNRFFNEASLSNELGFVVNDDEAGGYMVMKCLLEHGHTDIGFLAGPQTSSGSFLREQAYAKVLQEFKVEYKPELIRHCPPTVDAGRKTAIQLLQEHPEISAMFCFNDLVAIGALQCCLALGRKVPGDLAITGYDDIPMASWVTPSLTTCRVTFDEMGRAATRLLIKHIRERSQNYDSVILEPELIVRESAP